ncbi:MAG: N-acetylmuramic acid 6-phosphate etherase [Planctomycetota bacterium]|nr:N-acetylmuramic acid 6-phosphate etherase [Planctomycetota bacterium]
MPAARRAKRGRGKSGWTSAKDTGAGGGAARGEGRAGGKGGRRRHGTVPLDRLETEQPNPASAAIDRASIPEILRAINGEDAKVPGAVREAIPAIARAVETITARLKSGGRLFYVGAGTSGRLGVVDASEMPPTYGTDPSLVQAVIAGGPEAVFRSMEGAEDDYGAGRRDLAARGVGPRDAVLGLSASGRARYVAGALDLAREVGAAAIAFTCNANSDLLKHAGIGIVVRTGPEIIAGSTRMKAGTAEKLTLNMISTTVMILLGRVRGNRMAFLQPKCRKLRERSEAILMAEAGVTRSEARRALKACGGSVAEALKLLAGR